MYICMILGLSGPSEPSQASERSSEIRSRYCSVDSETACELTEYGEEASETSLVDDVYFSAILTNNCRNRRDRLSQS